MSHVVIMKVEYRTLLPPEVNIIIIVDVYVDVIECVLNTLFTRVHLSVRIVPYSQQMLSRTLFLDKFWNRPQ